MKKISIIMGAGAIVESTKASSKEITRAVIRRCRNIPAYEGSNVSLIELICKSYLKLYDSDEKLCFSKARYWYTKVLEIINFEDIFHVLELLAGFKNNGIVYGYNSGYKVFAEFKKDFENVESVAIYRTAYAVIDEINEIVGKYDGLLVNISR